MGMSPVLGVIDLSNDIGENQFSLSQKVSIMCTPSFSPPVFELNFLALSGALIFHLIEEETNFQLKMLDHNILYILLKCFEYLL